MSRFDNDYGRVWSLGNQNALPIHESVWDLAPEGQCVIKRGAAMGLVAGTGKVAPLAGSFLSFDGSKAEPTA